ncbi:MAG: hypothetical protein MHMPM18_005223 [Marteilia pararefringens]
MNLKIEEITKENKFLKLKLDNANKIDCIPERTHIDRGINVCDSETKVSTRFPNYKDVSKPINEYIYENDSMLLQFDNEFKILRYDDQNFEIDCPYFNRKVNGHCINTQYKSCPFSDKFDFDNNLCEVYDKNKHIVFSSSIYQVKKSD